MSDTPPYRQPFVLDVDPVPAERSGDLDLYLPDTPDRVPAILFVPGGPAPHKHPREWPVYQGYGAAAASLGVVGAVLEHRLVHGLDQLENAAGEVDAAVEQLRSDPQVDPDRIALWFFSGSGLLAGPWLERRPAWLRCLAVSYPQLAVRDRTLPVPAPVDAIAKSAGLPVLLTRVGRERAELAGPVAEFVEAAGSGEAALEVIDVPDGRHGFDMLDHTDASRDAVRRALSWTAGHLGVVPATRDPSPAPVPPPAPHTAGPVDIVDRQLAAYNTHDLETFLSTYAPDAQLVERDGRVLRGRRALRERYGRELADRSCRANVLNRIAEGEWVVDHQILNGIAPEPVRVAMLYRVFRGLIVEVRQLA